MSENTQDPSSNPRDSRDNTDSSPETTPEATPATLTQSPEGDYLSSPPNPPEVVSTLNEAEIKAESASTAGPLTEAEPEPEAGPLAEARSGEPAEPKEDFQEEEPSATPVVEPQSLQKDSGDYFSCFSEEPEEKEAKDSGIFGFQDTDKFAKLKKNFQSWWQASRPSYYIATIFPLLIGYFAALKIEKTTEGLEVSTGIFVLILISSFLVHLATNIANDYFENKEGVDSLESLGGSRVLQEGKLAPQCLRNGLIAFYGIAFILALFIVQTYWTLWVLVLFAFFSSLFYVAPPIKYGHRALGELSVFLNMGLIMVVGTFMALTQVYSKEVLALAMPSAFMVAAILFFQSLPEMDSDPKVGKITLASLLGKERAALVYFLWWPLVWFLILMLFLTDRVSWIALLSILTLPIHLIVWKRIVESEDLALLDKTGYLVRILYLLNSLFLLIGVIQKG
ncbi:MAG: UbiA family prenyltransferase [Deltaproteobacteria bacterium]|jgi:1,4-dihydroxy-2-naphthoate octaprenyltransferase|nr:UbiA family prenyltransferase [Deltaproteobacteria bacterium]